MRELKISSNDKILILAPHPDDECIGAGGLLMRYPEQCEVVVMTDGSIADPSVETDKMKKMREEEFSCAMDRAGIRKQRILGYPDGELIFHPECLDEIDFSGFSKVLVPYAEEEHPDHRALYAYAVSKMIRQQTPAEIFQYETRGSMTDPTDYIDISGVIEDKKKLIYEYHSQIRIFDHAEYIEKINKRNADRINGENGSCYECYKKVIAGSEKEIDIDKEKSIARIKKQNEILSKWLEKMISGRRIRDYMSSEGIDTIAIYGYGELGKLLYKDLNRSEIRVLWIMDKKAGNMDDPDELLCVPKSGHPPVDIVIISTLYNERKIADELNAMGYQKAVGWHDLFVKMG